LILLDRQGLIRIESGEVLVSDRRLDTQQLWPGRSYRLPRVIDRATFLLPICTKGKGRVAPPQYRPWPKKG
jgi:hypothetical protein